MRAYPLCPRAIAALFTTVLIVPLVVGCHRQDTDDVLVAVPVPAAPSDSARTTALAVPGPGGIALYPGSKPYETGQKFPSSTSSDGATMSLYETPDPADRVIAFYDARFSFTDPISGKIIHPDQSRWKMGDRDAVTLTDKQPGFGLRSVGVHDVDGKTIIEIVSVAARRNGRPPFRPAVNAKPHDTPADTAPPRLDQMPDAPVGR